MLNVCVHSITNADVEEKGVNEEKAMVNGISVSGDGLWRMTGFSSLFGVTTLIGWFSGKIVDIIVKSKYCKSCEFGSLKEGTAEYEEWKANHENQCSLRGSSTFAVSKNRIFFSYFESRHYKEHAL